MTERLGRVALGGLQGRSAAGGLVPRDTVNIIQQPGFGITLGAGQFVDLNDLVTMTAVVTTAARYQTFQTLIGSAGAAGATNYYQVGAGKRYVNLAALFGPRTTSTAAHEAVLGYGDTGVNDTVAAPTNAVGRLIQTLLTLNGGGAATSFFYQPLIVPLFFLVPASKFPYAFFPAGALGLSVTLYGVERPA